MIGQSDRPFRLTKGPKGKKRRKTNFDVQEALEGKGKQRCDKIGVQLSGPYSDRFWSETLLTLYHIECGAHCQSIANV